ncbi:MAG: hypothetical protein V4702_05930 [Patescibacteria group bacterium]
MHRKAASNEQRAMSSENTLMALILVFGVCADRVHIVGKAFVQTVYICSGYAQVVFATKVLCTKPGIVRSLSERLAQAFTHVNLAFNRFVLVVIHIVPSPNNDYYKGV